MEANDKRFTEAARHDTITGMANETILVVDDDPEIVSTLRDYFEQAGYRVLTAYSGRSALERIRSERPDCVLLDVMLPDIDGWSVTRDVRGDDRVADISIIMLTARVDDMDKVVGLEMGADDYVTKPFNPREVLARVRAQLRRHQPKIASTMLTIGRIQLDLSRTRVYLNNEPIELTPTEFDILKTMMQHPGYVFTREELLEKALDYTYAGLGRTLDSHIKNLRRKIEPDPRQPMYILTVFGIGYRFAERGA
ncbi:MAG: response regulator transcription factor [Candidatus Promineifilaceae bacterium]